MIKEEGSAPPSPQLKTLLFQQSFFIKKVYIYAEYNTTTFFNPITIRSIANGRGIPASKHSWVNIEAISTLQLLLHGRYTSLFNQYSCYLVYLCETRIDVGLHYVFSHFLQWNWIIYRKKHAYEEMFVFPLAIAIQT